MDKNEKKIMFKLSPELVDGCSWTIVDSKEAVLSAVDEWCKAFKDDEGEHFEVKTVLMSQTELEALPEL